MGEIDLFKKFSYLIGQCAKKEKLLKNNYTKNVKINTHECNSLSSKHKITLDRLTCH